MHISFSFKVGRSDVPNESHITEHTQDIIRRVLLQGFTRGLFKTSDWLREDLKESAVNVGLTPVTLPQIAQPGRRFVAVFNNADNEIYLGSAAVSTNIGLPLPAGVPFTVNLDEKLSLYAVAGTENNDVRVLEGK